MKTSYHSPFLASIFRGLGWLNLLATVLLLYFAFKLSSAKFSFLPTGSGNIYAALSAAFLPTAALLLALAFFGAGQFIEYLAQIAHHTHRLCEQNESIAHKTAAAMVGAIPIPPLTKLREVSEGENGKRLGPPKKLFHYKTGETVLGPVDKAALQELINQGKIGHDTSIWVDGAENWQRLEDFAKS